MPSLKVYFRLGILCFKKMFAKSGFYVRLSLIRKCMKGMVTKMSVTRHDIRESEFIFIFEKTFRDESISELIDLSWDNEAITINDEVKETVEGVYNHLEEIDAVISKYSTKRSIERIPKINLSALRLAVYEINYKSDKAPITPVINEAVGLVKKYAQEQDVSFVNGVLGSYSRSLEADKKSDN